MLHSIHKMLKCDHIRDLYTKCNPCVISHCRDQTLWNHFWSMRPQGTITMKRPRPQFWDHATWNIVIYIIKQHDNWILDKYSYTTYQLILFHDDTHVLESNCSKYFQFLCFLSPPDSEIYSRLRSLLFKDDFTSWTSQCCVDTHMLIIQFWGNAHRIISTKVSRANRDNALNFHSFYQDRLQNEAMIIWYPVIDLG